MNRLKHTCSVLIAGLLVLASTATARAQYDIPLTPFQGFGDMVQQNLNFEARFYPWAAQRSIEVAREMRGQPLPFNAMTISNSVNQGNQAFYGYLHSMQQNSDAQLRAVGNYSNQAIRGYSPYVNNQGQGFMLPYIPNAYHMTPGGYIRPGTSNYPSSNFYYIR